MIAAEILSTMSPFKAATLCPVDALGAGDFFSQDMMISVKFPRLTATVFFAVFGALVGGIASKLFQYANSSMT
jgi:hypothetical protein